MSTSAINAFIALSRDFMADYFPGTSTAAGSTTTIVDTTALISKQNDWIPFGAGWVMLTEEPTGDAAIYDERTVSSFVASTGTLTTAAFAAAPGTGCDYVVTRLFSPTDYKTALIQAAKTAFPSLHSKIRNEAKRCNNWLKDGSMDYWSSTSALYYWTASSTTLTQTSTTRLFLNGSYSCKLSGTAGYVGQSIANNDDLKYLRGKHARFIARGWSDTASSLRLGIYDGTTTTYSDYHPAGSAWDDDEDTWEVEADISETATEVAFRVYHDQAAAVEYVDDCRVISGEYNKVYIGDLGLAQDYPKRVSVFYDDRGINEPIPLRNWHIDTDWLYLDEYYPDYLLRIEGIGYLDFLVSGAASTLWTATIEIDSPQLNILCAEAAVYLYNQRALTYTAGDRQEALANRDYWIMERDRLVAKFGMKTSSGTYVRWGV